jgi:hypothetical protein
MFVKFQHRHVFPSPDASSEAENSTFLTVRHKLNIDVSSLFSFFKCGKPGQ